MTVAVYAQKFGFENRLGLHYSRFRLSRRSIILPNQLLGSAWPAENRRFPRRIREVGLEAAKATGSAEHIEQALARLDELKADLDRIEVALAERAIT
jgi:hypothetical protein